MSKKGTLASHMKTVKVKVVADVFGNYKKGDMIDMHKSTAKACVEHGVVSYANKK